MKSLQMVLDRIEGRMAVLLIDGCPQPVILPRRFLPEEAVEGVTLNVSFEVDQKSTDDARKRVQDLIDELSGGEED